MYVYIDISINEYIHMINHNYASELTLHSHPGVDRIWSCSDKSQQKWEYLRTSRILPTSE